MKAMALPIGVQIYSLRNAVSAAPHIGLSHNRKTSPSNWVMGLKHQYEHCMPLQYGICTCLYC